MTWYFVRFIAEYDSYQIYTFVQLLYDAMFTGSVKWISFKIAGSSYISAVIIIQFYVCYILVKYNSYLVCNI